MERSTGQAGGLGRSAARRWRRALATARLGAALLLAGSLPGPGAALAGVPAKGPPAPTGLAFALVRGGALRHVRLEHGRLISRAAGGEVAGERQLSALELEALHAAARQALADPYPPHRCVGEETFVVVTVEGRTNSASVCSVRNRPEAERWVTLLEMLRRLLK